MEDNNLIHKFVDKVKSKFTKNSKGYPSVAEYAFSSEELEKISEENKQKILDLKQEVYPKKEKKKTEILKTLNKMNEKNISDEEEENTSADEVIEEKDSLKNEEGSSETEDKQLKEEKLEDLVQKIENKPVNSFVDINSDNQRLIMEKWNEIDIKEIDKDIMDGKEILNHNYTITYADEAERFIHDIRKKYEIVICYLIGFNNEKKGIFDKTIFSLKMDDEWKHLAQYIKILEKIRNFKKQVWFLVFFFLKGRTVLVFWLKKYLP